MSRIAYRIGTDTPDYEANDLSGKGAEITGGRWNEKGVAVVYAAENRSLACLETLVHLAAVGLPFNRYLVEISIPDPVWAAALRETPASLPVGWDAEPAGRASIDFGTAWLRSWSSSVLIIPSVIVSEECCVLLNPAHPDSASIGAVKLRRWLYHPRLTHASASATASRTKRARPIRGRRFLDQDFNHQRPSAPTTYVRFRIRSPKPD